MFLSDHHPITVTLSFPETFTRTKIWRLNPSLLKDLAVVDHVCERIHLYFIENTSPDMSPISLWEAHKCVIRGELLALSAKHKKEFQAKLLALTKTIKTLELSHKQTCAHSTLRELIKAWSSLLEELGILSKRRYVLSQMIFYEHGNKCGRLLARSVQASRPSSRIHL